MPSKNRLRLLWLQGTTCNGNTHSFLNHPRLQNILKHFTLLYHPVLASQASLEEVASLQYDCDILIFEGSFDRELIRAGKLMQTIFEHYQTSARHVIALGTCASYGGILKQSNPHFSSGLLFDGKKKVDDIIKDDSKLINIPGCPIHPEWLGFVLEAIVSKLPLPLDEEYRPVELFASLTHHGCDRNEYFEWKVDAQTFGTKEGCLFYEQGCRGPMTHALCNKVLWNETNSKTRAGTPCFGCTEADFPRENLFATKTNMSIPDEAPLGVPKRAYLTLAGIAKTFHIKRLEEKLIDYEKDHRKDRR